MFVETMQRIATFKFPPSPCEYLPHQQSQLECELRAELDPMEYMQRLKEGWRRFGPVVFRPDCLECRSCQSLRIPVATFRQSAGQRRTWKRNQGEMELLVGTPVASSERLELLTKFHEHGHQVKGWPADEDYDLRLKLHVTNPLPTEEWSYWIGERLVGVGYVDPLPEGLSAVYFFHDPAEHRRSLGTFNILKMVEAARRRGLPHVYLGYYVEGCRSMEYKARFRPNEILAAADWRSFVK